MPQLNQIKLMKKNLRIDTKNKLRKLSAGNKELQSNAVVDKLLESPLYQNSLNVSVYISTENEINTSRIIQNIFKCGKKCFIPRYRGDEMEMVILHSLEDLNNLPVTSWNIKQPSASEVRPNCFDLGGLDLIIAPGVAFTREGDRLGHGKGYYDRFLHTYFDDKYRKRPKTIALAFYEQLVSNIPLEENDVKIDKVLFTCD